MYAHSFLQFIHEQYRYQSPILDFCLHIYSKYMEIGKTFDDMPADIQRCIKSNGQTDVSRYIEKLYYKYIDGGETFDLIPNIIELLNAEGSLSFLEVLRDEIIENRKYLDYSFVPWGNITTFIIKGDNEVVNSIYYAVSEMIDDSSKMLGPDETEDFTELVIELEEEEADELKRLLYSS